MRSAKYIYIIDTMETFKCLEEYVHKKDCSKVSNYKGIYKAIFLIWKEGMFH